MTVIDLRRYSAVIFETDGVLTDTARIHAATWKRALDDFLRHRPGLTAEQTRPFHVRDDYLRHLDGRPRLDGARSFLASRGVTLPPGPETDEALAELGGVKDTLFLTEIRRHGVAAFPAAMAVVRELRRHGARLAAISPSRNCAEILAHAGMGDMFDARVDGVDAAEYGLPAMPDPAMPLRAARLLAAEPYECVVVAATGPALHAARQGRFGLVVGLRPHERPSPESGADCLLDDLAELRVSGRVPLILHGDASI
jgi:beta-phosphoglucomutase-like phosphatase (HAD superfamily)